MVIVDYKYYSETYLGGRKALILEEDFTYYERRAEAELSYLTMDRISQEEPTDKIRSCICEVMEQLFKAEAREGIKSENNDGYSVVYGDNTKEDIILLTAKKYLPQRLLFRGANPRR